MFIRKRIKYNCHIGECDKAFSYYCPACGQAIDWSGEDE